MQFILLLVAVILFILAGAGIGPFEVGTIKLTILPFGLACFAAAFLIGTTGLTLPKRA
jgi:hypothetical protein